MTTPISFKEIGTDFKEYKSSKNFKKYIPYIVGGVLIGGVALFLKSRKSSGGYTISKDIPQLPSVESQEVIFDTDPLNRALNESIESITTEQQTYFSSIDDRLQKTIDSVNAQISNFVEGQSSIPSNSSVVEVEEPVIVPTVIGQTSLSPVSQDSEGSAKTFDWGPNVAQDVPENLKSLIGGYVGVGEQKPESLAPKTLDTETAHKTLSHSERLAQRGW